MKNFIDGLFGNPEPKKVLLKIESLKDSTTTWCSLIELRKLPVPQKRQIREFLISLSEDLK